MPPSDKCPEEATRGRHLFPASVTIKAECRGFTRLRHRQNTAPSSPPLPHNERSRGFQGCGIRLLSSFPHITAAHPFVGCPASTCPATRHIADAECEEEDEKEDEKDGLVGAHSGAACQYWATSDQTCLSDPPPPTYKPLDQQHAAIRHQLSCQPGAGSSSNLYECGQFRCQ